MVSSEKLRAVCDMPSKFPVCRQIPSLRAEICMRRWVKTLWRLPLPATGFYTITTPMLAPRTWTLPTNPCCFFFIFPPQCQDFPTLLRPQLPRTEVHTYEAGVARCTTRSEQQLPLLPSQPTAGKELSASSPLDQHRSLEPGHHSQPCHARVVPARRLRLARRLEKWL